MSTDMDMDEAVFARAAHVICMILFFCPSQSCWVEREKEKEGMKSSNELISVVYSVFFSLKQTGYCLVWVQIFEKTQKVTKLTPIISLETGMTQD